MNIWMIGKKSMKLYKLKKKFLQSLKMENITDADYAHEEKVCKDFEIRNLREYHDLYVQSDTLC